MIISVFNYTWFLVIAFTIVYIVLITKKYKDKSEEEKINFMLKQSIFLCVAWILYKVGLAFDKDYTLFEFWNELPLQPCNTVIWLSIIAAIKNNKTIMAYSFFAGTIFAIMALLMPSNGFYDYNFLTVRCIGYYGTHALVIATGILYATLGLFEIKPILAIKSVLFFVFMTVCLHIVNFVLRSTVYHEASYYYTFGNPDNSILTALHNIIPINLIYLLPIEIVAVPIFLFEVWIIKTIGQKIHKQKDQN